jgi:hypothetical protein
LDLSGLIYTRRVANLPMHVRRAGGFGKLGEWRPTNALNKAYVGGGGGAGGAWSARHAQLLCVLNIRKWPSAKKRPKGIAVTALAVAPLDLVARAVNAHAAL